MKLAIVGMCAVALIVLGGCEADTKAARQLSAPGPAPTAQAEPRQHADVPSGDIYLEQMLGRYDLGR